MKRSRFTEEQIIGILREQESRGKGGRLVLQVWDVGSHPVHLEGQVRRHGSLGCQAPQGAGGRERQTQEAAGRGDARCLSLARPTLKIVVGSVAKRAAVAHLQAGFGLSERQACTLIGADRCWIRYRSGRPDDAALRGRLRTLAQERRRFGYRRLFVLLRREGETAGLNRIYRKEGLTVRKRQARRRAIGTRAPILVEAKANARWSLDFVHDQFANGRRFRILNIVDDVRWECLAAIPETSISGKRRPGTDSPDRAPWQTGDGCFR